MARTDYGAILSSVIQDTSDAIREVKGSTGLIAPSQWGAEIRGIKENSNDVNYFDCFGNLVFNYSAEQFAELTAHPTGSNVSKKGVALTFDEWNYTFSDAQTYVAKYGKLSIGGTYHPTDGKTHIFLNIGNSAYSDIDIRFTADSTATVDWGDGNTETVSGAFSGKHNYNNSGEFEITIDGNISIEGVLLPDVSQANYLTDAFLNGITSIGNNAFYLCASLESVTIPEGVMSIGSNAFYLCTSLKSVIIPESVTSIGGGAFSNCTSLKSVIIPESVTSIVGGTFSNCPSLKSVIIPESVTSIGSYAFVYLSLKSITIPDSVTSIDSNAFNSFRNLVYVDISEATTIPTLGTNAFSNTNSLVAIIVPDNLYDDWIVATNWSAYASKIVKASEYIKPF